MRNYEHAMENAMRLAEAAVERPALAAASSAWRGIAHELRVGGSKREHAYSSMNVAPVLLPAPNYDEDKTLPNEEDFTHPDIYSGGGVGEATFAPGMDADLEPDGTPEDAGADAPPPLNPL